MGIGCVIPLPTEFIANDIYFGKFLIRHLDSGFILSKIQSTFDMQAALGCGGCNKIHNNFQCIQRLCPPVPTDLTEHPMLYLVPFGCPWWKAEDFNWH